MWILSVLQITYIVIMEICINAPVSSRIKIDSIKASNKIYLNGKKMIRTEECNNESTITNAASNICDKNK